MAILDVFKKKAKEPKELDLPPPPIPHDEISEQELPNLPPLPEEHADMDTHDIVFPELPPLKEEHEIPKIKAEGAVLPPPEPMPREVVRETPVHEFRELEEYEEVPQEITKQVFVNVADYQEILQGIDKVRHTLSDSEEIISKLNDLKNAEDKVYEDWRTHIEDIERKLTYIDQVIFRGE